MSLIRNLLSQVRYYLSGDPYHRDVDNRPLKDMAKNDELLVDGSDALIASQTPLAGAIAWALRGYAEENTAVGRLQYNGNLTLTLVRAIATVNTTVTTNAHPVDTARIALATAAQTLTFSAAGIAVGYSRPYSIQAQVVAEDATIPGFDPADPGTTAQFKSLFTGGVNQVKKLLFTAVAGSDQLIGPPYTFPTPVGGAFEVMRVVLGHNQTVIASQDVELTGWWEEGGGTDDDPFLTLSRAYANGIDRDLALTGNAVGDADLDTVTTVGEYSFEGLNPAQDAVKNRPFTAGVLKVRQKGVVIAQDAHSAVDGAVASRTYNGASWSTWLVITAGSGGLSDQLVHVRTDVGNTTVDTLPAGTRSLTVLGIGVGGAGNTWGQDGTARGGGGGGGGPGSAAVFTVYGDLGGFTVFSEFGTPDTPANNGWAGTDAWGGTSDGFTPLASHDSTAYAGNPFLPSMATDSFITLVDSVGRPVYQVCLPAGETGGIGKDGRYGGNKGGSGGKAGIPFEVFNLLGKGYTHEFHYAQGDYSWPGFNLVGAANELNYSFSGSKGDYKVVQAGFINAAGVFLPSRSRIVRLRGAVDDGQNVAMADTEVTVYAGPLGSTRGGPGAAWQGSRPGPLVSNQGNWDAQANPSYPTVGSGVGGTVAAGDHWTVSVPGRIGRFYYPAEYVFIARVNSPGQDISNWDHVSAGAAVVVPEHIASWAAPLLSMTTAQFPGSYGAGGIGHHYSGGPGIDPLLATAGGPGLVIIMAGKGPL